MRKEHKTAYAVAGYSSRTRLPDARSIPDEHSLHLALRGKNGVWQPLNFGIGVLFAEADFNTKDPAGLTILLDQVDLYRCPDGRIAVTADLITAKGVLRGRAAWQTTDLVHYSLMPRDTGSFPSDMSVGAFPSAAPRERIQIGNNSPIEASVLEITESEYDFLVKKLGEVRNVSADPIEITLSREETEVDLPPLTARYSDGSTEEIPIDWDGDILASIPFGRPGVYCVPGKPVVKDYGSPMIPGVADPMVRLLNGKYYLIGTNEFTDAHDLWLRCADSIDALPDGERACIFHATPSGDCSGCNWAPELHIIGGKLRCLFAASTTGDWKHVQSRVMTCEGDPMDPASWSEAERVLRADGTPLNPDGITLDMTYIEAAGRSYYCWASRPIDGNVYGTSDLMIAPIDPQQPNRLTGEPVLLCRPTYAWDRQFAEVNEGPFALYHDGKIYLSFSGSAVSDYYCLGWLIADETADLLDPNAWEEVGYPVLAREHVAGERGPGHNSFTKDEYGRDVIFYHAKPNGGMRSTYARTIHYAADGTPLLTLNPDRFLSPEFRHVTARITIV